MTQNRIELDDIQLGYFQATRLNTQTMNEQAKIIQAEADQLSQKAQAFIRSAKRAEGDMLAKIGEAHGVEIPEDALIDTKDGTTCFSWGRQPGRKPLQRAKKRKAAGNGASKKKTAKA